MILYLDASAMVKRYVAEDGSSDVAHAIQESELTGTSIITRVETVAAFSKAMRVGALDATEAEAALQHFRVDWTDIARVQASELVVSRAASLAWEHGLRGYDAVQLASALAWQDGLQESVVFATYDRHLWHTGRKSGLKCFPAILPYH